MNISSPVVQAEHVSKQVATGEGPLVILDDISFDVPAGAVLGVLGASGSGKSTLLGLLAGLDEPTAGRVILDGTDLNTLDEDGRAALRAGRVGFVFQSFQLLPGLTALENVMLPLELAGEADARRLAAEVLERVDLGRRTAHYPSQLSGGEQQRCAIARAFAPRPRLLFADEPTGNLDSRTGKQVIDLMLTLNREQGTTLVLVTHDAALAERCDSHLELEQGRLLARAEASAGAGTGSAAGS